MQRTEGHVILPVLAMLWQGLARRPAVLNCLEELWSAVILAVKDVDRTYAGGGDNILLQKWSDLVFFLPAVH